VLRSQLKVVFLIGSADSATKRAIGRICRLKDVEIVAVLMDTGVPTARERWSNLKRNVRREGLPYVFHRAVTALRSELETRANLIVPREEVQTLLDRAFPENSLQGLAKKYGFPIFEAGNLNQDPAVERLRSVGADLGIVMGTRILKRRLFSLPRLGCINLHKGKVPEYRGTAPGFWELCDGCDTAGVTVHYIDDGLDSGDIVATSEISIHPLETPESLRAKLDEEGSCLLASAVSEIQQGRAVRRPQPATAKRPRTRPTEIQKQALARRLPHWRRLSDGRQTVKLALWLLLFHSGLWFLLRRLRAGESRGAILLYHRVNDSSQDVLTASIERFAEHLVTLRHYYHLAPTEEIVKRVEAGLPLKATTVAIHFDDCYRDVRTWAAPLLQAAGIPAVAFVSSGFVDTAREFCHDRENSPQRFLNLTTEDLRELPDMGVTVAAHSVNHRDLGSIGLAEANVEVVESRRELEMMLGRPVQLFSFPFGEEHNIRDEVRQMVKQAGYSALFSASGGFVNRHTSPFDIPRFGVSSDHSPLALIMKLEGISLSHPADVLWEQFQPHLERWGERLRRAPFHFKPVRWSKHGS
jgi:peptidoglycan/xylan/chitin deacetylase (PgdA/CDA1 family)/folate-dependent phosphoribosylglycinamide formyltransferase PurN